MRNTWIESMTKAAAEVWNQDEIPSRLFHYTGAAAVMGIVENGVFWATNLLHLNDRSEVSYAYELTAQAIENRKASETSDQVSGFLGTLNDSLCPTIFRSEEGMQVSLNSTRREGVALMLVFFMVTGIFSIVAAASLFSNARSRANVDSQNEIQAFYLAAAGLEAAKW